MCGCIQGVKRTKLGLREFVRLGDFIQSIDTTKSLAVRRFPKRRDERTRQCFGMSFYLNIRAQGKFSCCHAPNQSGEQGRLLCNRPWPHKRQPNNHSIIQKVCGRNIIPFFICILTSFHPSQSKCQLGIVHSSSILSDITFVSMQPQV